MPERMPLSRDRVVATALHLADRDGVAGLSMRRIAAELGVEAMSLYHHVANKEAILAALVDAVVTEYHLPRVGAPWRQEIERRSVTAREALHRHPWAVPLMDSNAQAGMALIRDHDAVIGCLRAAGFSLTLTAHVFAVVDAHLYGFVSHELTLPFDPGADLTRMADDMAASLPFAELPHFAEFVTEVALQPGYDFGNEFGWGLELILDAIEQRREAELAELA